jgi:hypothetical protein
MEIWGQIKDLDWSLVSSSGVGNNWPNWLWPMEKHYRWLGASGVYGVGYGAPAAVGVALANRDLGRFSVNIQADGGTERAADLGSGRNSLMISVGWLSRLHHPARICCGGTQQWDRGFGHSIFL